MRPRSDKRRRDMDDSDPELELNSDFKQILTILRYIKDKAHKNGQKKAEQAISRLQESVPGCELGITSVMLFVND
ncbi:uncharacterized protein LOC119312716 [Triticum dicoccoides]|uniref:uncharacterized protein LOC119312716 n=1 Tax=Triticum dicoccoides TaxID=85692 RepID=UPI001891B1CC|nr:uncharacterized protein LOC119312716 [Triticum dicoccoides]